MENKILVVVLKDNNSVVNKLIDVPSNKLMKDYIDEIWGKLLLSSDGNKINVIIMVTLGDEISYSKAETINSMSWPTYYSSLYDMRESSKIGMTVSYIVLQIINKMSDWGIDIDGEVIYLGDDDFDFETFNNPILTDNDISEIVDMYKNKTYVPFDIEVGDKIYDEIQNLVTYKFCVNKDITFDELMRDIKDYRTDINNSIKTILDNIYEYQKDKPYLSK